MENAIERAVVLGVGAEIGPEDLQEQVVGSRQAPDRKVVLKAGFHEAMEDHRRRLILNALEQTDWNRSKAADLLGLQRTYLARLIKNLKVNTHRRDR